MAKQKLEEILLMEMKYNENTLILPSNSHLQHLDGTQLSQTNNHSHPSAQCILSEAFWYHKNWSKTEFEERTLKELANSMNPC